MRTAAPPIGSRVIGAVCAAAVVCLFGMLFLRGFEMPVSLPASMKTQLLNFTLEPPPPPVPPPPPPPRKAAPKPKGEAAPPNLKSRSTEIVAPPPIRPVPVPVIAAKQADLGSDATSGAALVAGPGTGAGGAGRGTGGGGGGGTPLRWLSGELTDDDYPESALEAGKSGTVGLRFTVGVNGRVTRCVVTRSSGNAALDETTCRLIQKRFRYAPTRDAQGNAVPDTVTGEHEWEIYDRPRRD